MTSAYDIAHTADRLRDQMATLPDGPYRDRLGRARRRLIDRLKRIDATSVPPAPVQVVEIRPAPTPTEPIRVAAACPDCATLRQQIAERDAAAARAMCVSRPNVAMVRHHLTRLRDTVQEIIAVIQDPQ